MITKKFNEMVSLVEKPYSRRDFLNENWDAGIELEGKKPLTESVKKTTESLDKSRGQWDQAETAKEFGIYTGIKLLEIDLMNIEGVSNVDFDLSGLYDKLPIAIIIDIDKNIPTDRYYDEIRRIAKEVKEVAKAFNIKQADPMEFNDNYIYWAVNFNNKDLSANESLDPEEEYNWRRVVERSYHLEEGELDGLTVKEAEKVCGEEEGGLDRFLYDYDGNFVGDEEDIKENLKEEYGPYKDNVYLEQIADELENGSDYGDIDGHKWELKISTNHGEVTEDTVSSAMYDILLHDISLPVRDGHKSYDSIDFILVNEEDVTKEDLEYMGFDEEDIKAYLKDSSTEIETYYDYEIDTGDWDIEEEKEEVDLPTEVTYDFYSLVDDDVDITSDDYNLDDEIADRLSDDYGYTHFGFDYDVDKRSGDVYVYNIKWDLEEKLIQSKTLKEDTIKQNGKWVNKGEEGTHGKFRTKKEADAQRKAMFANSGKNRNFGESVNDKAKGVMVILLDGDYAFFFDEEAEKLSDILTLQKREFSDKLKNKYKVEPGVHTYTTIPATELSKYKDRVEIVDNLDEGLYSKEELVQSDSDVFNPFEDQKQRYGLYIQKEYDEGEYKRDYEKNDLDDVIDFATTFYSYDGSDDTLFGFIWDKNTGEIVWDANIAGLTDDEFETPWGDKEKRELPWGYTHDDLDEKLIQGKSDATLKKNIKTEIEAGKDPKQAYAIAKSVQKKNMKEELSAEEINSVKDRWVKTNDKFLKEGLSDNEVIAKDTINIDGVEYTIDVYSNDFGYIAHWEDNTDNGLDYNNQGFVNASNADMKLSLKEKGKAFPSDYISVISIYDRPLKKSVANKIMRKVLSMKEENLKEEDLTEGRKRTRKEIVVLQGNYGYGWDDLIEYELTGDIDKDMEIYKEIRQDKKDYQENEPQYSHRTVHRFEKITQDDTVSEDIKDKNLKENLDNEICLYLFPELTDEDKKELANYNLTYLGKNSFKEDDYESISDVVRGSKEDLIKYGKEYLDYTLHPDYLYLEDDFAGDIINENFEPFFFAKDDYFREEAKYYIDKLNVVDFMDKYDSFRDFVDNEFSVKVLGALGNTQEMDELYKYYIQEAPEQAKIGERLWGAIVNEGTVIKTNLDINNMVDELRKQYKDVTNKDYIKNSIALHRRFNMITWEEAKQLAKEFNLEEKLKEEFEENKTFKVGDKVKISDKFHVDALRNAEGIITNVQPDYEFIDIKFTSGPEKGEEHPYTAKNLVKIEEDFEFVKPIIKAIEDRFEGIRIASYSNNKIVLDKEQLRVITAKMVADYINNRDLGVKATPRGNLIDLNKSNENLKESQSVLSDKAKERLARKKGARMLEALRTKDGFEENEEVYFQVGDYIDGETCYHTLKRRNNFDKKNEYKVVAIDYGFRQKDKDAQPHKDEETGMLVMPELEVIYDKPKIVGVVEFNSEDNQDIEDAYFEDNRRYKKLVLDLFKEKGVKPTEESLTEVKHDLYVNGEYVASTKQYKRAKDWKDKILQDRKVKWAGMKSLMSGGTELDSMDIKPDDKVVVRRDKNEAMKPESKEHPSKN